MFNAFKQASVKYNKPYILVSGDVNNRIKVQ